MIFKFQQPDRRGINIPVDQRKSPDMCARANTSFDPWHPAAGFSCQRHDGYSRTLQLVVPFPENHTDHRERQRQPVPAGCRSARRWQSSPEKRHGFPWDAVQIAAAAGRCTALASTNASYSEPNSRNPNSPSKLVRWTDTPTPPSATTKRRWPAGPRRRSSLARHVDVHVQALETIARRIQVSRHSGRLSA